jgi:hypothetical protein
LVSISYGHGNLYDFERGFLFKGSSTYTTSAQGGVGNDTTIDASLTQANDYWNGCYIKFLTCTNAANVGIIREITDFDAATDTLTHDAFPARTENGDTFLLSPWVLIEDGQTLATPVELYDDYVDVEATGTGGNAAGYINNFTNLGLSTTTYTTIRWRYKTSDTSIKAKIVLEFNDASTQEVLADASSTTFTVGSATITTAKTLDHIRLHADHAVGHVYYDYVLVYKADWTLPNAAYDINGEIPVTVVDLPVPVRHTDPSQNLGSGNMPYRLGCDMTIGDWTRVGDTVNGQVFYDIAGNSTTEPWQWFDSEREQMKVTLRPPVFTRGSTGMGLMDRLDVFLNEYRRSDAGNSLESYVTRWGLDL